MMKENTMLLRTVCVLLVTGLLGAGCAAPGAPAAPGASATAAPAAPKDSIYIADAWARPSPLPSGNSAVYLTVVNPLDRVDHLLSVSSELGVASLHESITENDVVRMEARPDGFELPPAGSLALAPGGKHVMIMGITEPLAAGDMVTITLNFEMYGPMTISVAVEDKPGL
jgi:copper(I)-binding protein